MAPMSMGKNWQTECTFTKRISKMPLENNTKLYPNKKLMRHSMKGLEKWSSYGKKDIGNKRLPYNVPLVLGTEQEFVLDAIYKKNLSTDGFYIKACAEVLQKLTGCLKAVMTTSCTDAL